MKHYKNRNGQVFGFDNDQLHLVTSDMVEMTDAEFYEFCNPTPTPEQLLEQLRIERNQRLAELDRPMWLTNLTTEQKALVDIYYKQLLDATKTGIIPDRLEFI